MMLVVDANILFSFFWRDSIVREIILDPKFEYNLELFSPEYALLELDRHKDEICKKANITSDEFEFPRNSLEAFVKIVSTKFWKERISDAIKLFPKHPKDIPYFALALSLNCGIWSNEKRFKKQSKVKIFSTDDLLKILKLR